MNEKLFTAFIESPELLNSDSLPQIKTVIEDYPWFHAGWFFYLKNLKNCNSADFETELKKAAIHVTDRKKFHDFLNPKQIAITDIPTSDLKFDSVSDDDHSTQRNTNNLIDRFLTTSQTIKKRIIPAFEEEIKEDHLERIQQSVSENDELITETLALIFVKQKKYDKAIDAFTKLSIKYPEKSIYFAARIKDVELLMNF